jgi:hypothetical protein
MGFPSVKAKVIRLTKVDECGEVIYGVCSTIVSDGFISIQSSPELEEGEEFTQKNAWGDLCVNDKDADRLKRFNLTIELCQVDPALLSFFIGSDTIESGGEVIGAQVGENVAEDGFSLEAWTKVAGGACGTAGAWIYWLWPWVTNGSLGDFTLENGPLTMTVNANTLGAPASYGQGPYEPPGLMVPVNEGRHLAFNQTTTQPPDVTDGCAELVSPGAPLATTATAGTPGTFGPGGSARPSTKSELDTITGANVTPQTSWVPGDYVWIGADDTVPNRYHWDGLVWVAGEAT